MKMITAILGVCCSFLFAADKINTQNAFYLELNRDGLGLVATELRKSHLHDVDGDALPDIQQTVDYGIDVTVQGTRYGITFDSLTITPEAGAIRVDIGAKRMWVHTDRMRFHKKLLIDLETTCLDTGLEVGHAGVVHLTGDFIPEVKDGQLKLQSGSVGFAISDDNFKINGPRECSGALGLGSLVKVVVRHVLSKARPKLEEKVRSQVAQLIPSLEAKINQEVHRTFHFDLPEMPPLPHTQIALVTSPYHVAVTPEALSFHLNVDVAKELVGNTDEELFANAAPLPLGSVGVNPELFSEIFARIVSSGTDYIELSEERIPKIREILSKKMATAFWPDLQSVSTTADYLKVFVRFKSAPVFTLSESESALKANISGIQFKFMIERDHQWIPYFHMDLSVKSGTTLRTEAGKLVVQLTQQNIVEVTGHWDPGYTPSIAAFQSEMAGALFSGLLDYLSMSGPIAKVSLPELTFGDRKIAFTDARVLAPFIRSTLVALE